MDLRYAYDMAGNPIRVGDEVTGRAECYAYDGYRRLTDAWTPADGNCATAPDQAVLGGPAGFWTSEELDEIGNRTRQDRTTVTGATTSTTSTVFTYPEPGEVRPHAPLSVSATRSVGGTTPTGATTDAGVFSYDEAGNTTTDPELFGTTKSLSWDAEGRLERVIGPAGVSSFTYTADGDRLVRRDPGSTTVYLPGGQELTTTTANGQVRATRYYTAGGTTVAVRTEADDSEAFPFGQVDVVVADPHGTGQLAVNTHTGEVVRRHSDPYGNPLDQTGAWPTDRGFLDKPVDATGYTHIGARYYNPAHGRFLSVDPVMDLTDPAQWHAYAYANNNPITYSDPTGLAPMTTPHYNYTLGPPKHQDYTPGYNPVWNPTNGDPPVDLPTTFNQLQAEHRAEEYVALFDSMSWQEGERLVGAGAWTIFSDQALVYRKWLSVCSEVECAPPCPDNACQAWRAFQLLAATVGPSWAGLGLTKAWGAYRASRIANAANTEARVFSNLAPGDAVRPQGFAAISPTSLGSASGRYNYVVGTNGRLVPGNRRYGHIDLANGGRVLAAGEVRVVNGQVVSINNASGHYRPFGPGAQSAAERAFGSSGLVVRPGAYVEVHR